MSARRKDMNLRSRKAWIGCAAACAGEVLGNTLSEFLSTGTTERGAFEVLKTAVLDPDLMAPLLWLITVAASLHWFLFRYTVMRRHTAEQTRRSTS